MARFGIWEADFPNATITISEGLTAIMELSGDRRRLTTAEFDALIHPEDLPALRAEVHLPEMHGRTIQNEFRLMLPSGAVRWMRSQWCFERSDGPPTRATGAMIDITAEKRMLAQSQEARATAEAAARAARQAERLEQDRKTILELVAKDRPLDLIATAMAHAVSSYLPGSLCSIQIELTETSHISRVFPIPGARLAKALDHVPIGSIRETLSSEPIATLSNSPEWLLFIENSGDSPFQHYRAVPIFRNTRLAGTIVSFLTENRPASRAEEQLLESWGQFASLAVERRGLYEQLSFRAQYDSLTTLLNRASLYDRLDAEIRRSHAENRAVAVVYVDLDRFKEINDRYGHGAGDTVLQHVSRRILDSVGPADTAARIGGDEFVVILPGVSDRLEASRSADRVVDAIERESSVNGHEVCVGASFGISIYPDDGAHTDALLKMADEDMYRAKLKTPVGPDQTGQHAVETDPRDESFFRASQGVAAGSRYVRLEQGLDGRFREHRVSTSRKGVRILAPGGYTADRLNEIGQSALSLAVSSAFEMQIDKAGNTTHFQIHVDPGGLFPRRSGETQTRTLLLSFVYFNEGRPQIATEAVSVNVNPTSSRFRRGKKWISDHVDQTIPGVTSKVWIVVQDTATGVTGSLSIPIASQSGGHLPR